MVAIAGGHVVMNSGIVKGKSSLGVRLDFSQLAPPKGGHPRGMVGLKFEPRITGFLRQYQQPLAKPLGGVQLASPPTKQPLAPQCREYIRALTQWFAKLLGPRIGFQHLRSPKSSGCHEGRSDSNVQFDFGLGALDRVPDVRRGIKRTPQVADRLFIGVAPLGHGTGLAPVTDCLARKSGLAEMMGNDLG